MAFPDLVLPDSLAVWDPLGGTQEPAMTGHTGIAVHTMAGSFAGTDAMFHQNGWTGTESTVGVAGSGHCKQWVSWGRQADANLDMNGLWLSIENADAGEDFPPLAEANDENPPLTPQQIERNIRLCVYWCDPASHRNCPTNWRCRTEGIPAVFADSSCDRGIGTHRAGIDPWRPSGCPLMSRAGGKICPRSVRLRQVRDIIVPEVARRLAGQPVQEDDDVTIIRFSAPGKPERLFIDGIVHGWSSNADRIAMLNGLKEAGFKIATPDPLTVSGYESFSRSAITGSDFADIENKLEAIAMYEAAQLEVETREEERDLAAEPPPPPSG